MRGVHHSMSGHSKWHNIQKTKGAQDAKRAQAFTKIAREMIVAVKEGGSGDPANNSRLASVVAKAKAANMPNDNIKRTIEKALGGGDTSNFESITYEGYGPSGVAVIVETMTDNRNRTGSEVRHYFDKYGGNMGQQGSVMFMFSRQGVVRVADEDDELDEDQVMEDALEAGADDVIHDEGLFDIRTAVNAVADVSEALAAKGYEIISAEAEYIPSTYTKLEGDNIQQMGKMLEMFEDNDDIQAVWHNWEHEDDYE